MPLEIRTERLGARLDALRRFGLQPSGGVTRYAYSAEEKAATDTVAGWMQEAGLAVRRDAVGNLFGRLPGRSRGPAVLAGSHLDSVPNGGHFDGPAGVLAALEAAQSLREAGLVPELPVEVVSFIGEEGSRFPWGLLGSSFVAGTFPADRCAAMIDRSGVTLRAAMAEYGADPDQAATAAAAPGAYAVYLELHIEQSGLLETEDVPAGIVTGIAGMRQLKGRIQGRAEHAGACPMHLRRDPLPAAAHLVLFAERVAWESDPATRATVGMIAARPGAANVIPAEAELSFDVRDLDGARRDQAVERIRAEFARVCAERGLQGDLKEEHVTPPVPCDPEVVRALGAAAAAAGIPVRHLPSGAVHDGANLARLCPVGMVFVRSRDGISHSPAEFSTLEDVAAGTRILAEAVARLSRAARP